MRIVIEHTDELFEAVLALVTRKGQQAPALSRAEVLQERIWNARRMEETPEVAPPYVAPDEIAQAPSDKPGNLDSEGLPWDSRIHSSSKAKNSDGTWRIKRNSDKEFVAGVVAELKKVMAIPKPDAAGVTVAQMMDHFTPRVLQSPKLSIQDDVITMQLPPAPAVEPPPPTVSAVPPPPVAAPAADTLAGLMDYIMERNKAGTLPMATVTHTVKAQGLGSLRDLDARPDLIPAFKAALEAI